MTEALLLLSMFALVVLPGVALVWLYDRIYRFGVKRGWWK